MNTDTGTARTAIDILNHKARLERGIENAYHRRLLGHSDPWSLRGRMDDATLASWASDQLQILGTIGARLENLPGIVEKAAGLCDARTGDQAFDDLIRECRRALPHIERLADVAPFGGPKNDNDDDFVRDAFATLLDAVRRAASHAFAAEHA